ncbi:MAG: hypothetical protein Unbinned202contig1002_38 [Prokaryotic dsDNA virus sp.]|nr:MAG: hypothetical protein Unbinned202contig1002_38 [Prokaryotic dsDNA virus sp.]|tara:strand:+ start:16723 stop:16986 length:264 start_codon:yes stop_codon:yes gene_type:complete
MSQKNPEHIIEYILKKTERKWSREHWKFKKKYKKVEYSLDNTICYCEICGQTWSKVPDWVDPLKWRKYPKGNVPTIGKKRKICRGCK